MHRTTGERTTTIGQRSDVFPDRDSRGEIQDIAQNGITLGTWGIRQGGSPPFPDDNEDKNAKQQGIENRCVDHSDKERTPEGGRRTAFFPGALDLSMQ